MRIGFDIMGGDFAPKEAIAGAILALQEIGPDDKIVLIGDSEQASAALSAKIEAANAQQVISNNITIDSEPLNCIIPEQASSVTAEGITRTCKLYCALCAIARRVSSSCSLECTVREHIPKAKRAGLYVTISND